MKEFGGPVGENITSFLTISFSKIEKQNERKGKIS